MFRTAPRRSLRRLPILVLPVTALAVGSGASASTVPPTVPPAVASTVPGAEAPEELPEGYVRLVDDTAFLTVIVPETWTVVDTAPSANDDGSPQPWIFASAVEPTEFNETFGSGVLYVATPYEADAETFLNENGLTGGCETIEVEAYSDPIFTGSVQVGTNCGPDGGTWNMIAASPEDQSFTAVVQLQIASPEEQADFDAVLDTFTYAGDPTVPAGAMVPSPTVPGSSVPG